MGIKVRNLSIDLMAGEDNVCYARWDHPASTVTTETTSSSGGVSAGSLVSITSGATYYNGVAVPDWVKSRKWYVLSVSGDRAVINKDESGSYAIMSPINVKYLSGGSSSSSTSSSTTTTEVSNVSHYEVIWRYKTNAGVTFEGSSADVDYYDMTNSTYTIPDNATAVICYVRPMSKTYEDDNGNEKKYWTGEWASVTLYPANERPAKPGAPDVELVDGQIVMTVDNIEDPRTDFIEFWVAKDNAKFAQGKAQVLLSRAILKYVYLPGGEYRVRCRAINTTGGMSYSDWSDYAGPFKTRPGIIQNVKCEADSKTSVKVSWVHAVAYESYTVEYTTKKEYFDTSSSVSSVTTTINTAYITGLEGGHTYYFRVRASNKEGDSDWSAITSAVVGTKPEPPTTWSLSTTAMVGEDIILYWTHNSEDGSKQREAQLYLNIDGNIEYITVTSSVDEDEEEPVYSYTLPSKNYADGGKIRWMVQTKGVVDEYSEWSVQRTIDLFAPPVMTVSTNIVGDAVTSLPITMTATAEPSNQIPLSYHISVTAVNAYNTVDNVGNDITVLAGSNVYAQTIISSDRPFEHTISAEDITLESGQSYILTVTAAMDSGLMATRDIEFDVSWASRDYICDASVTIDKETLSAYITPFCLGDNNVIIQDVTLAVYRREADGSFTEIGSGLSNTMVTTVTDPHPSLDYARYRIVATDMTNGAVEYSDLPGEPVNEHAIVIQWDEEWDTFDHREGIPTDAPAWAGSMVRLPYNIDVSEKSDHDVSLIEYIGRKNPVAYYGTQRGEGGSWSTEIDKKDVETVYALRRLKSWTGDVYVREPSGIGYWANISISMNRRHKELTIPVSINVTRVEGGM